MASNGQQTRHLKVLRRLRAVLMKELPDPAVLLSTSELTPHFTEYEKSQVLSPKIPSERAEKLVDIMEFKSYQVFEKFVVVVRRFKPELGVRIEGVERDLSGSEQQHGLSNGYSQNVNEEQLVVPIEESRNQPQALRRVEDAGLYGLSGHGDGPVYHLSHLSYSGREFLSKHLNGNPPERHVFQNFCQALGVEHRLVQASLKSRNPTGYLIQEYGRRPEATFNKLERALSEIGKQDLYQQVFVMMTNDEQDEECN